MQYRTLESLCKIASGGTPSRSKKEYWDGGDVPWIKIGNIKSKVVSNADEYITEAGLNNSSAKLFKKGTILYTIFATLGEVGILDFDACTNQAIAGVSIEKPEEITADYLYYYLKSKKAEVNKIGRGVAQNNINLSILRKFLIPMRAIEEQKTIVNSLNKIESIIEKQKQQLEQLNNLIKARFVEMFKDEDPVFAFDDVLIDDTKNGFKLDSSNYSNLGKIAIVDQGQKRICGYINAVDGKAPWSKEAIIFGDHTEMFKYINFPFYLGADGTKLLSPKNGWNTRFLYHYLDINYHKRLGYMRHFKYLKEMSFIKPDLDRQEEFCMFCTQVDKSKFALSNELAMGNFYIRLIHDCIMHGCIDL